MLQVNMYTKHYAAREYVYQALCYKGICIPSIMLEVNMYTKHYATSEYVYQALCYKGICIPSIMLQVNMYTKLGPALELCD